MTIIAFSSSAILAPTASRGSGSHEHVRQEQPHRRSPSLRGKPLPVYESRLQAGISIGVLAHLRRADH